MSKFKIGYNFDYKLIDGIKRLNYASTNGNVINEVYSSDRAHAELTARPDFRVANVSLDEMATHISRLKDIGVTFNYVANSIMPYGSKRELYNNLDNIKMFLHSLDRIGVGRITCSNMLMLEIVAETLPNMPIELSTIAELSAVTQIKYLKEKYPMLDKICGSLIRNRDMKFLSAAAKVCSDLGIVYDVMVNEFCGVGSDNYATGCVYRQNCYQCHASNKTQDDAELFDNFPMNRCMSSRDVNPGCWLKMRFIRPEDLKAYNKLGIIDFKITGRTGTTDYIIKTVEHYMKETYDGNVLGLWKNLETITTGECELSCKQPANISNKALDGFINHWIENDVRCSEELCGTTCNYCNDFYNKITKE